MKKNFDDRTFKRLIEWGNKLDAKKINKTIEA